MAGVVHAVAYSLLLLNTDLHVAELSTRMSRNQFVRNTLSAIQMQVHPNGSNSDFDSSSGRQGSDHISGTPGKSIKRSDSMTSWSSLSRDGVPGLSKTLLPQVNDSTSSFLAVSNDQGGNGGVTTMYDRNWENDMEAMLKVSRTAMSPPIPKLSESIGNVYGHKKPASPATSGHFRAGIHFFSLTSRDVIAQSQHSWPT